MALSNIFGPYKTGLKLFSPELRKHMIDAEQLLWSRLRRKQLLGVQFYRQKPLAGFIVGFYSAAASLVIELDGPQHFEEAHQSHDKERDQVLAAMGLLVLRFDNRQVLQELDLVMQVIFDAVEKQISPCFPFSKGVKARGMNRLN
ncbi:endonuclease domain-containing protein [Iodobacter ciconiae]|uniref:Endonuclease domain-containing protein n=2 Tax=Iodobacter ciconiae TaxID=2496266 RepID=A0A3S8ZXF0_9NEIS|nr:endonuclease domain-containing protein [Iodobacter ciconiae]